MPQTDTHTHVQRGRDIDVKLIKFLFLRRGLKKSLLPNVLPDYSEVKRNGDIFGSLCMYVYSMVVTKP